MASGLTPNRRIENWQPRSLSMRERLRMIGGAFLIHSEIGKGTQVEAGFRWWVNEHLGTRRNWSRL
jgi:signal transduction histidine kinase